MANIIDADGITVKTQAEIIAEISADLEDAYGSEINLDSSSPDGQLVNIFAQAIVDVQDLLVQIYNSFNPDNAVGTVLDQRVAINGIQRQGGTYTYQNIVIETDRSLSLVGLDADILDPDGTGYTVSDDEGNQWILTASTTITTAGTTSLAFRAKNNGAVLSVPDTITTPRTIVLGVLSVNNPDPYTTLGEDEETDAALRLRRQKSVSLASQGYLASLTAELLNISGVSYAKIYENTTGSTDSDSIPGHSIWTIVEGGNDEDIAYAIYTKRNAGCGMKGSESVLVEQVDGSFFEIKFDRTASENLYVEMDATSIDLVTTIDTTFLANGLVSAVNLDVNESININYLASLIRDIDENALVTNLGVSTDGSTFYNIVSPTAKNKRLVLTAGNISITVV